MDKFGRMSWHVHTKSGMGFRDDVTVNDAALDVNSRIIKNVGSPTEPADAVNKRYVDAMVFSTKNEVNRPYVDEKMSSLQKELKSLKDTMSRWDDHILKIYGRESNFLKMQDWDELFKEAIQDEKNKVTQSLLDLISGKIKRPSALENTDSDKISKIELLAVLEAWQK